MGNKQKNESAPLNRIAKSLGIPEEFMQFEKFVKAFEGIVKLSCLDSTDSEIRSVIPSYSSDLSFITNNLIDKIVLHLQTNHSTFHNTYGNWVRGNICTFNLANHNAIRVDKDRVLLQAFTSTKSGRSVFHIAYSIDENGNLLEDKFVEKASSNNYYRTFFNRENEVIYTSKITFDHLGFSKDITRRTGNSKPVTERDKHPSCFSNYLSFRFFDTER